jgi:hypothetical protein
LKTTSVPNTARLVPGVVIVNNVVANTRGNAALLFSGDPNSGTGAAAPVPYGRIVNNTIYGVSPLQSIGVQVTDNASPTLLNNVFSNLATGISVDPSSSGTVIGFSAFHATPGGRLGTNQVVLPTDPFVNAGRGNFYPAAKSLVIDTALDVLQDRDAFTAVTQQLGIPVSPIIAPGRDMYGQRRADDPGQETPTGLGSEVFKDLGAIDRTARVETEAAQAAQYRGADARIVLDDQDDRRGAVRHRVASSNGSGAAERGCSARSMPAGPRSSSAAASRGSKGATCDRASSQGP